MKSAAIAGLAALLLATLVSGRDARAQFKDEDEPEVEQFERHARFVLLNEANLCQWALGVPNADAARTRLDALLTITIDDVDRACGLTDAQKHKLRLAGKGDLKRTWDVVDNSIRKYANVRVRQDELNRVFQELQTVQVSLTGSPFESGTLFAKMLSTMLTPDQMARLERSNAARAAYAYRAKVELVVANLDQLAGLTDARRQQLVTLILNETKLPEKSTRYDYQVASYQVAKLPEAKLRAIFDDLQWRLVRPTLEQAARMELFLIQNGLLPGHEGKAPAQHAGPRDRPAPVQNTPFQIPFIQ